MRLFYSFLFGFLMIGFMACSSKSETKENVDTQKTTTEEPALVNKQNKLKTNKNVKQASTSSVLTTGTNVNWMTITDVESAMKKEKRKVMVDLYTSWCGWCKRMDKATFQNPEIADYLNEKFYAVKFNAEDQNTINFKGENHKFVAAGRKGYNELAHKFANGRMSYPTIAFLDENLDRIDSYPGYKQPQQFDPLLKFIDGNHYKSKSLAEFSQGFQSRVAPTPGAGNGSQVQLTRKGANGKVKQLAGQKPGVKLQKQQGQTRGNFKVKGDKVQIQPKKVDGSRLRKNVKVESGGE